MQLSAALVSKDEKPDFAPTGEVQSGNQSLHIVNAVGALSTVRVWLFSHPLICFEHPSPWMTTSVAAGIFPHTMLM